MHQAQNYRANQSRIPHKRPSRTLLYTTPSARSQKLRTCRITESSLLSKHDAVLSCIEQRRAQETCNEEHKSTDRKERFLTMCKTNPKRTQNEGKTNPKRRQSKAYLSQGKGGSAQALPIEQRVSLAASRRPSREHEATKAAKAKSKRIKRRPHPRRLGGAGVPIQVSVFTDGGCCWSAWCCA